MAWFYCRVEVVPRCHDGAHSLVACGHADLGGGYSLEAGRVYFAGFTGEGEGQGEGEGYELVGCWIKSLVALCPPQPQNLL